MKLTAKWCVADIDGQRLIDAFTDPSGPFVLSWGDGDEQWEGWSAEEGTFTLAAEQRGLVSVIWTVDDIGPGNAALVAEARDLWLSPTPTDEFRICTYHPVSGKFWDYEAHEWGME